MRKLVFALSCLLSLGAIASAQESATVIGTNDLKVRFDGRITFDGAVYAPSTDIEGVRYGSDNFRFSNAGNLSQLRLGLNATFGTKWLGRFDVDFSNRRVNLTDVIINYYIDSKSRLTMGYFKDPVSMDNSTASRLLSVQTPMAVAMLTRGERYWGVTYINYGRHHWLAGGIYAGTVGNRTTVANRGDDGYGVAMRAAYIPVNNDYTTVHLGAYTRWRRPEPSEATPTGDRALSYTGAPESAIDGHRFLGFSVSDVKSYHLMGVEAAVKFDKLYFNGEYLVTRLMRTSGNNVISGWTLTGSYMLRGNQRTYVASDAFFSPVANVAKGGNLELIARVGQVDLNDDKAGHAILGGKAFSTMVGLNWYPRANLLFALNYTYMDNDKHANSMGAITNIPDRGIDFHTLQLRAQVIF